jgi:ribose transport system permease protein
MGARLRVLLSDVQELVPIYAVMIVVIAANAALQGNLVSNGNLTDLLVQLAPYILAAMAQTLVMLLAGIDLSVGAMMSLASTLLAKHLGHGSTDVLVVLVVLAITGALGALTGVLIAVLRLPAIIVTLATSFLWGGLALQILPEPGGNVPDGVSVWVTGSYGAVPMVAVLLVICFLAWGHLRRTRTGLRIYAAGDAARAAQVTGLSVPAAHAWAFGLAGVLAGLAGLVLSCQTSSGDPSIGDPFTLSAIAAAVLGGVSFFGGEGRMAGSVAGAVVIGMLVNLLLYANVSSFYQYIVQGAILIAVVAFTTWRKGVSLAALASGGQGATELREG